jgi:TetR/AcrR family transcriptional regulator, tetracycline repressor protein
MANQRLTVDGIIAAAVALVEAKGPAALTMRNLGRHLGVDATAVYRHIPDKAELEALVGDRVLRSVCDSPAVGSADDRVIGICVRLRHAALSQPGLARFVVAAPTGQRHERAITEALLGFLREAGLDEYRAAEAYHALIELTIGSAAIDAPLASRASEERAATYDRWRVGYATADPQRFPHSRACADLLYRTSADERFVVAVTALLRGLLAVDQRADQPSDQ